VSNLGRGGRKARSEKGKTEKKGKETREGGREGLNDCRATRDLRHLLLSNFSSYHFRKVRSRRDKGMRKTREDRGGMGEIGVKRTGIKYGYDHPLKKGFRGT